MACSKLFAVNLALMLAVVNPLTVLEDADGMSPAVARHRTACERERMHRVCLCVSDAERSRRE